ncbi:MAG: hypothetical protein M1831_004900 [Alyxoria varia]|nr:MAG: hypothetical protein M1831_004900 [Alyxoria varia]
MPIPVPSKKGRVELKERRKSFVVEEGEGVLERRSSGQDARGGRELGEREGQSTEARDAESGCGMISEGVRLHHRSLLGDWVGGGGRGSSEVDEKGCEHTENYHGIDDLNDGEGQPTDAEDAERGHEPTGTGVNLHRRSLLPRESSLVAKVSANILQSQEIEDRARAKREIKNNEHAVAGTQEMEQAVETQAIPEAKSKPDTSSTDRAATADHSTRIKKTQPRRSTTAALSRGASGKIAADAKNAPAKDKAEPARQRQSGRTWNLNAGASSRRQTSSEKNPQVQPQTATNRVSKGNDGRATVAGTTPKETRTTIAKPTRSASTTSPSRRPSSKLREPSRPSFNTFQQHFTPAKERSGFAPASTSLARSSSVRSSVTGPQKPRPQSKHPTGMNKRSNRCSISTDRLDPANNNITSPSKSRTPSNPTTALYPPLQTHLLHLTILAQQSEPTLTSYTKSAHDALFNGWQELQKAYLEQLETCKQARQAKNLLGLHRWTSGNTVALERKLKNLGDVLAELRRLVMDEKDRPIVETSSRKTMDQEGRAQLGPRLWIGDDEHSDDDAEAPTSPPPPPGAQTGRYARLIQQFERWSDWVSTVWAQRDEDTTSDVATATGGMDETFRRLTRIEPPGDAMKAEIKDLTAVVERLHSRLDDLSSPYVPVIGELEKFWGEEGDEDGNVAAKDGKEDVAVPTARRLIVLAGTLIAGMREELQVIREVIYEIEVGEREYMRSMVLGTWETGVRARLDR